MWNIEAQFNDETSEIELYQFKTVVEDGDVADPDIEIELLEAKKEDPGVELGDSIGIKLDSAIFGRIAAQRQNRLSTRRSVMLKENLYIRVPCKKG